MGAKFHLFNPKITNPEKFYDFDLEEEKQSYHACEVFGPINLRGAEVNAYDIRAGAALVLAALCAKGKTIISGLKHLDRGYENFVEKLTNLKAIIKPA